MRNYLSGRMRRLAYVLALGSAIFPQQSNSDISRLEKNVEEGIEMIARADSLSGTWGAEPDTIQASILYSSAASILDPGVYGTSDLLEAVPDTLQIWRPYIVLDKLAAYANQGLAFLSPKGMRERLFQKSRELYEGALELDKDDEFALRNLACVLEELGDPMAGIVRFHYREVLERKGAKMPLKKS